MKTLYVKFRGPTSSWQHNKEYAYFYEGDDAAVNKIAVVNSPTSGYSLVDIVRIVDGVSPCATKRIVCIVDDTKYTSIEQAQRERKQLLEKLAKIHAQLQQEEQFAYLANHSDEAKEMLRRLSEINGTLSAA